VNDADWKARAEEAERRLAEQHVAVFEQKLESIMQNRDLPIRKRAALILRAYADLVELDLPAGAFASAFEKWNGMFSDLAKEGSDGA
jgi:hypothetical protein